MRPSIAIPQELAIANQRERLLDAATTLFAERGYAALTVPSITSRAGVSRAAFYELFEDKLDCVFGAYDAAFDQLKRSLLHSWTSHLTWSEGVASAVAAALSFAAGSPAQAQLLALAPAGAVDSRLTKRALAANEYLLGLLRQGREGGPAANEPLALTEQTLLLGVTHVVGAELVAGQAVQLPQMAPELSQIILTPYLGGAEASRFVTHEVSSSQGCVT